MSNTLSPISASASQAMQEPTLAQVQRKASSRTQDDPQAGAVSAATVAIQRNQNTARVETELQQQLTAKQASNVSQIRDQGNAQNAQASQNAPVATAAARSPGPTQQERAATSAREQSTRQAEARAQQQRAAEARQAESAAQQAANARAPNTASSAAVNQYQANQGLLQPSGTNTHQVYTRA